jgi:pimeloyl-ACP methyl ester carboxylesterase
MAMPYADLTHARIFYTDQGTAPSSVLLVHGWACDSHDWSGQIDDFEAAGYRVIVPDSRGHGQSSTPPVGYDPVDMATDLAELVELLEAGPVVAIGHSLGGFVVSVLAVRWPELVRAVVVVDPGYGALTDELSEQVTELSRALATPHGLDLATQAFAAMEGPATPTALKTWHRRRLLATAPTVLAAALLGIFEHEAAIGTRSAATDYLAQRACPVLALHTDPEKAEWENTTFTHPLSRTVSWEGAGHWLHQERPARFNGVVLAWMNDLP